VDDGFVVGQRQQISVENNRSSQPRTGLDLPHQHDQRLSGGGVGRLLVDLAGKRRARPMRALLIPFEPLAVIVFPRIVEQGDVGGAWASRLSAVIS
jgi:hypothetical protein